MKHLWEVNHSYYFECHNYAFTTFKSWSDFVDNFGDADKDYNLLFRFDWKEGMRHDLTPFNGDVNYRNGELSLFFVIQRKGYILEQRIEVCRADESAVIAWITPHMEHQLKLWEPIL